MLRGWRRIPPRALITGRTANGASRRHRQGGRAPPAVRLETRSRRGHGRSRADRGRACRDAPPAPPHPLAVSRLLAAGRSAGRAGPALAAPGQGRHRVPGRGPLPVGRPPGVGALAARPAPPAVCAVLLRGPRRLPAARGPGRQPRRPGRRPGAVPGLHARGDRAGLGQRPPDRRPADRVLRRGTVRRSRAHPARGDVRHLRRAVGAADRGGGLAGDPGRHPPGGDRLDGGRRGRAGAGQRLRLLVRPVRPRHLAIAFAGRLAAVRRESGRRAGRDSADRHGGPPGGGSTDRRQGLCPRRHDDHPGPGGRPGLRAVRARRRLDAGPA